MDRVWDEYGSNVIMVDWNGRGTVVGVDATELTSRADCEQG